jgi:hypothetical protein
MMEIGASSMPRGIAEREPADRTDETLAFNPAGRTGQVESYRSSSTLLSVAGLSGRSRRQPRGLSGLPATTMESGRKSYLRSSKSSVNTGCRWSPGGGPTDRHHPVAGSMQPYRSAGDRPSFIASPDCCLITAMSCFL